MARKRSFGLTRLVVTLGCVLGLSTPLHAGKLLPPITALALAPDETLVLVGSQAGLEVRTFPELKGVRTLATSLTNLHDLAFSPDGSMLAVVGGSPGETGIVELYAWPSGTLLNRAEPHLDVIYGVCWSTEGGMFATVSADQSTILHAAPSLKKLRSLEGHSRGILAVAFLASTELATAGIDESIRLWESSDGKLRRTLTNHTRAVHGLAARPGDAAGPPVLASASADKTVRVWQPTIGRLVRFARLKSVPLAVTWTLDGRYIVTSCADGHVCRIDPDTAAVVQDAEAIDGLAYCVAAAGDGSVLVGGSNGTLRRVQMSYQTNGLAP